MLFSLILACSDTTTPQKTRIFDYELVWSDEFDGPSKAPVDPTKWTHDIGTGPNGDGWGNQQLEYNTDSIDNVRLNGDGILEIFARREEYMGMSYTSGRLKTQGLFDVQFGRVEARIMIPQGQGLWPAFWMLGSNITEIPWPQCGEIDILEFQGSKPERLIGSLHGPGYSGGESISNSYRLTDSTFADDFHVFSIDWDPDLIVWYVDDMEYHRVSRWEIPEMAGWVYEQPFFLLLNLAVGGHFVEAPLTTSFPSRLKVDYVRVYQRVE